MLVVTNNWPTALTTGEKYPSLITKFEETDSCVPTTHLVACVAYFKLVRNDRASCKGGEEAGKHGGRVQIADERILQVSCSMTLILLCTNWLICLENKFCELKFVWISFLAMAAWQQQCNCADLLNCLQNIVSNKICHLVHSVSLIYLSFKIS